MTKNEPWVRYVPKMKVGCETGIVSNHRSAQLAGTGYGSTEPPAEPHYKVSVELVVPEPKWWYWDGISWGPSTIAHDPQDVWAAGTRCRVYGTYGDDINQKRDTMLEAARKAGRYEHDS